MEKIDTKIKIIQFIENREQVSVNQLADFFCISRQSIHRHLLSLVNSGEIKKQGTPPYVFYSINKNSDYKLKAEGGVFKFTMGEGSVNKLTKDQIACIEHNFFVIDPTGQRHVGVEAFVLWCKKRNFDISKKADEYLNTTKKLELYKENGVISGTQKLKSTFDKVYVDKMLYLDFYSIEIFGKTKLGQMMLYAKQGQDKKIIKELSMEIKDKIQKVIQNQNIDAVGFIPPTVKREVQFLKEVEKNLNIPLPKILLSKIRGEFTVPQKTLSKLEGRIENAKQIRVHFMGDVVNDQIPLYKNILLIDDALGSGSTLNEVARQIQALNLAEKVTGLAITGSLNGFDVISEV